MKVNKDGEDADAVVDEGAKVDEVPPGESTEVPTGGEEEIDIDLNDPEVEKAATKIQAGFKGFKARKEVKALKTDKDGEVAAESEAPPAEGEEAPPASKEEVIDIDLNDPEVEKAATKIQAGFKGYKTRKGFSEKKAADGEAAEGGDEEKKE